MKHFIVLKEYFIKYKNRIMLGLIALIIVNWLQLILPRFVKYVVDDINTGKMTGISLYKWALLILLVAFFMAFFRFFWRYFILGTSHKIRELLRNRFFSHLH
ncbi:ABC transporter ATP-binding protein, partial [candidate division WOR-3 bacterium]|nr:ABC transporter ATP-binding protein [candidate division WOR-3 bacterium]